VRVWEDQSFRGYPQLEVSPANFRDWQHMSHSFASLAAYADSAVNMLGQGSPERLASANVTANLFDTLGVSPALGRSFTVDDDRAGAAGAVILSHRLWQSHFGGDPRVVGRTIVLNDERFAVIGVMRADFEFPSRETTLWVPFRWVANDFDARDNFWLYPIARLRNGTTLEDARVEMKVIAAQLERAYPKENERTSAGVYLLRDGVSDRARLLLMALAGGSVCILLIACINLASLLVARALSRQREFAVRCAIGAGRERLVRQMLTESVVLAGLGGMGGLALAAAAAPLIARLVPPTLPIAETPPLDARVLGIAFAATLLTGVGFGLVPALRMSRARMDALREGARSGTSRPTERLRSILVVAQVTATVVLLMTSGLLLRALWRVQSTDPGFRVEDVQTFRTALPFPRYEQTMRRAAFYRRVLGEVRHVPGVSQAAYISFLPMTCAAASGLWCPRAPPQTRTRGPRPASVS
jgi:predicted permease